MCVDPEPQNPSWVLINYFYYRLYKSTCPGIGPVMVDMGRGGWLNLPNGVHYWLAFVLFWNSIRVEKSEIVIFWKTYFLDIDTDTYS